jgi:hypothetical protein
METVVACEYVDGSGLVLCPVAGFGITGIELLGYTTRELVHMRQNRPS